MNTDSRPDTPFAPMGDAGGASLNQRLKTEIVRRIESGAWPVDHRLPSENELVEMLGVSRMTVHRALRELAAEGAIVRIQGKGSFVAPRKRSAPAVGVRNIADEIAERGARHSSQYTLGQTEVAGPDLGEALELALGTPVFHTVVLHLEDDLPIQIEDRFVNPQVAPRYLDQDFSRSTPNAYLTAVAPISRTEQFVEAVLPMAWEARLLSIARSEPCLLVRRRTWSGERCVTTVRLIYPGTRYRLESSG